MRRIELLAPAGDLIRLKTAVRYGADAVYIGGKALSLRSRASNFSLEDIAEGVRYAHAHGAKVHVTVNMIPHDDDLVGVQDYLQALEACGVDAIICASPAIMALCKECAPRLQIHVSTQQTTTNAAAIRYWQRMGADRVVLARETTLDEIAEITKQSQLETEVFIHGGMCVNYSGRCTLSNRMTLRDANRGGCAQSCRWKYRMYDVQGKRCSDEDVLFSMSAKDLQAARFIPALMAAGVTSLKIEGRMKTAYYIACVVKAYRALIDAYIATGMVTEAQIAECQKELARAENRPTAEGFFNGKPDAASHLYDRNGSGVLQDFVAQVLSYDPLDGVARVQVRNRFTAETVLEIVNPHVPLRQFTVTQLWDEERMAITVANRPMQVLYMKVPFAVEQDDFLRKAEAKVTR